LFQRLEFPYRGTDLVGSTEELVEFHFEQRPVAGPQGLGERIPRRGPPLLGCLPEPRLYEEDPLLLGVERSRTHLHVNLVLREEPLEFSGFPLKFCGLTNPERVAWVPFPFLAGPWFAGHARSREDPIRQAGVVASRVISLTFSPSDISLELLNS